MYKLIITLVACIRVFYNLYFLLTCVRHFVEDKNTEVDVIFPLVHAYIMFSESVEGFVKIPKF